MTTTRMRPAYEGSNIRTWVGFKHFMYLTEAAVLEWFRARAAGPSRLYHEHGLGLEIVDASVQLPAVLDMDDEVLATVEAATPGSFRVRLTTARDGTDVTVLRGRVTVRLVRERVVAGDGTGLPGDLEPLVVDGVEGVVTDAGTPEMPGDPRPGGVDARTLGGAGAFVMSEPIPYQWCHFGQRMQHSGYVRLLEAVVERFLADRGISVGRLLRERGWIPVVSRARVRMLSEACMEEQLHTRFAVTDMLKRLAFDGRMDCYVERDGRLVHTATARIVHGYAHSRGPQAGELVTFDDATVEALAGGRR